MWQRPEHTGGHWPACNICFSCQKRCSCSCCCAFLKEVFRASRCLAWWFAFKKADPTAGHVFLPTPTQTDKLPPNLAHPRACSGPNVFCAEEPKKSETNREQDTIGVVPLPPVPGFRSSSYRTARTAARQRRPATGRHTASPSAPPAAAAPTAPGPPARRGFPRGPGQPARPVAPSQCPNEGSQRLQQIAGVSSISTFWN